MKTVLKLKTTLALISVFALNFGCSQARFGQEDLGLSSKTSLAVVTNGTISTVLGPQAGEVLAANTGTTSAISPNSGQSPSGDANSGDHSSHETPSPNPNPTPAPTLDDLFIIISTYWKDGKIICHEGPEEYIQIMLGVSSLAGVPLCRNTGYPEGPISITFTICGLGNHHCNSEK